MTLTRVHRILVAVVITGAVVIAAIGFAGSYTAVRDLAAQKGFGGFAPFFPIGVDAGIVVLLALDLLLTWIRIPFPLLRQTAWLLTASTIAFNGAAAWPDPLGVGMHAVIPVLFVVTVEAARHAIGRIADITADKHMEGVRLSRWLLAFPSTFRLWRRMKLWELRSYDEVIRMEQDRLVYETRLRARYGRGWRRRAPVEALMPLKLARYGVPLAETVRPDPEREPAAPVERAVRPAPVAPPTDLGTGPYTDPGTGPDTAAGTTAVPEPQREPEPEAVPEPSLREGGVTVPVGPGGRRRALGSAGAGNGVSAYVPPQRSAEQQLFLASPPAPGQDRDPGGEQDAHAPGPLEDGQGPAGDPASAAPVGIPDGVPREEVYFRAYREHVAAQAAFPTARQLARVLQDDHGVTDAAGNPLGERYLGTYMREFKERYSMEMGL